MHFRLQVANAMDGKVSVTILRCHLLAINLAAVIHYVSIPMLLNFFYFYIFTKRLFN